MRNGILVLSVGLGLALVAGVSLARRSSAGEEESANVRKQCSAFVEAWNKHDAKAMSAVFAEDGDSINPMGQHATGRADVEKAFSAEHGEKGPMRESSIKVVDEPIRFVTPEVAVSDADVVLTGAIGPDGKKGAPLNVHVTNIWKKVDGKWTVFASRPYIKMASPPAGKAN
jgi:uncharacterized protein (TIGR02246 family)